MALTMAAMFPLYFIASSSLPGLPAALGLGNDLSTKLLLSMLVSFVLILGTPLLVASLRNIDFRSTFLLDWPSLKSWGLLLPATLLLGFSCWTFAHEIFLFGQALGIGTINIEQFDLASKLQESLKKVPLWIVLLTLAITPAVCEEFMFRGFVLSSFHRQSRASSILLSAFLFGLMHVLTSNVLAVERFLPTTFMGIILGWIAVRTGSLWPGMLVHALHNGLLLSLGVFEDELKAREILVNEGEHLPIPWLIGGGIGIAFGAALIWLYSRSASELATEQSEDLRSVSEAPVDVQVES
jgi:ABC-2 type transport system permease protein/sodium transport system permease protein